MTRRPNRFYDEHPAGIKYTLSRHAIDRALEMNVEGHEIADAMERPTDSYYSNTHEKWCLTAGRVTVCVDPSVEPAVIATVLWATKEAWQADYDRGGITDRDYRANPFASTTKKRPEPMTAGALHTQ